MKLLILFGILTLKSYCPEYRTLDILRYEPIQPYESIWKAVCFVESMGNPFAYNPKENAYGIVQIRQVRINDFNKQTGSHYQLKEMLDTIKAKEVFLFYADKHYFNEIEMISRCWNGGEENGIKYKQTKKYYLEVKKAML